MTTTRTRPLWSAEELATATGGRWQVKAPADFSPIRVSYDVSSGKLPRIAVLFRTKRTWRWFQPADDIKMAPSLAKHGPACFIVDPTQLAALRTMPLARPVPTLVVTDTRVALTKLAEAARARFRGRVLTLSGTVGKTTTREMLRVGLSASGPVMATMGNNNNTAGRERTLACVHQDDAFAVLEFGFGPPLGAFTASSKIVRPHVALMTTVDVAHADAFTEDIASPAELRRRIAEEKLRMADSLERGGRVVFNRDDDTWEVAVARAKHYRQELLSFGRSDDADVRLLAVEATDDGSLVRVDVAGTVVETQIAIPGAHMAMNVVAALAGIHALGADVRLAAEALRGFQAVSGRSEIVTIQAPRGGTATLIDDSFNATPASMRSSLRLLGDHASRHGGRRIAVLGDILHLGAAAEALHTSLAADVESAGVDVLFTTGRWMKRLHDACAPRIRAVHEDDLQALYDAIRAELREGDVVTTKSSTPLNTIAIAKALRSGASQVDKTPPKL